MIEKTTRMNVLFDFYQELLTPKQRNYMELYYLEDYSLGEIANIYQISRQAVYDHIKRTETVLETYEKKLGLFAKFMKRKSILEQLEQMVEDKRALELLSQLKDLD